MRGALITVRCDCGATKHVAYGERWTCEQCGRRWNTSQIPAEDYWGIMREMRRYRLTVIGVAVAIMAVFALLGTVAGAQFFVLMPLALGFWFLWYMPMWRRKVRRRTRSLPKWQLRPERDGDPSAP
jgi:Flp pilus assembly protein TadB